jgi:hypothetical protein
MGKRGSNSAVVMLADGDSQERFLEGLRLVGLKVFVNKTIGSSAQIPIALEFESVPRSAGARREFGKGIRTSGPNSHKEF